MANLVGDYTLKPWGPMVHDRSHQRADIRANRKPLNPISVLNIFVHICTRSIDKMHKAISMSWSWSTHLVVGERLSLSTPRKLLTWFQTKDQADRGGIKLTIKTFSELDDLKQNVNNKSVFLDPG